MATNKNALIRYRILDKCFRNPGRRYFIDDLIAECNKVLLEIDPSSEGISRRQIFDDIAFMESSEGWGIELEKHRENRKVYYRYADMSFSIEKSPLNEMEINQIKSAVNTLSRFKNMPQFEWINALVEKLELGVKGNQVDFPVIGFDNNQYLKGIENIGIIYNAITYKKVLSIKYFPFSTEQPENIEIHPYFLKQYNSRWFLFGYDTDWKRPDRNLALDRIISIKETNKKYHDNTSINWNDYFDDIIGVTIPTGSKVEKVVLLFHGITGKYIETKPLHGSQKSKWIEENTFEVRFDLILNYELQQLILSYGESVKVISPPFLKEIITTRLRKAIDQYSE
jgi:predicted DNA-binding transcriptional regulator YafY